MIQIEHLTKRYGAFKHFALFHLKGNVVNCSECAIALRKMFDLDHFP